MPTRSWQRDLDHQEARPVQLERDLALAREQIATIRRICAASGIDITRANPIECVQLLAREHGARGAMNAVLHRQQESRPVISEGPRRAERSIEAEQALTERRAQEEAMAFGSKAASAPAPARKPLNFHQFQRDIARLIPEARMVDAAPLEQGRRRY